MIQKEQLFFKKIHKINSLKHISEKIINLTKSQIKQTTDDRIYFEHLMVYNGLNQNFGGQLFDCNVSLVIYFR